MAEHPYVLDQAHLDFQRSVRDLARGELLEGYHARAARTEYPYDQLRSMAKAGLLDLVVRERLGGQGGDLLALGLATEEISYADPNLGYVVFSANLAAAFLAHQQHEEIRRWARGVGAGETVPCWAVTEPGAGSDASALTTRAERVDGGWVITGEKTSVTQAPYADIAIVLAQTDPALGARGIGCYLVECRDETVSSQDFADPGFKPLGRGSVTMDRTFVPDERVIAQPGRGFGAVMSEFDLSRTLIGLTCVGTAQRALDMAAAYSRERVAFGRPLAANQGVSFTIAEHVTYVTAVRALAYQVLGLRAAGRAHTTEAAMLKWWAPRVAFAAVQDAIVLHGQVGWSDEMPLQSLLRDVSGYQIGDGTPQIQKLIIARNVIGREAVEG